MQFLKRHPYAAVLVGLLLVCSFVDWTSWTMSGSRRSECYYGLLQGHFFGGYITHSDPTDEYAFFSGERGGLRFHSPSLGREWKWGQLEVPSTVKISDAAIPIYAPLLAVAAWVTFRELKRRKK